MITLRPYQTELVDRVVHALGNGAGTVVMQAGTGSGKTAMAAHILARAVFAGYRAVFLAHLDTIIEDTHDRLGAAGIQSGYVQAGRPTLPNAPVQVCSIATLHRRDELPPADLVIFDECHRAPGPTARALLERYPEASILGLTATPQRGDGRPLGDIFSELICGPSNKWLTEQGYLVPCDVLAGTNNARELSVDPVDAYCEYAPESRAIVFASNILHAQDIRDRLTKRHVVTELLLGDTPRAERRGMRDRVMRCETLVLVGVGVFIEGFDLPAIETVILARQMSVTGSYLQAIGRGLRPCPLYGKKKLLVLDLGGSVFLHGLPDDARTWSLTGKAVRPAETLTALRHCKNCLAIFRPAVVCPRCGARAEASSKVPRVLSRAEKLENVSALPQHERDARYLWSLRRVAEKNIGLYGVAIERWALSKFRQRFGRMPNAYTREGGSATN